MLYHFEIGFPKQVQKFSGVMNLRYSSHALKASRDDRYGQMSLPAQLNIQSAKLIEMEVENGMMVKGVYRMPYDAKLDIIIVVMRDGFVKTVWFNLNSDKHKTLQTWKYNKP